MDRRRLLKSMGVLGAAALSGTSEPRARAASPKEDFSFIFFTDTHIQPELKASEGCGMCFHTFHGISADFAICGGDLVFDASAVDPKRADALFGLFQQTSASIPYPVHYTLGNHDVFGVANKDGVAPSDPRYGKKAFEDHYGPTHYSFDHRGWHFVVLDSINIGPDRNWTAHIGDEQIAWLKADLGNLAKSTPVIVVTHVPLVTGALSYVPRSSWRDMNGLLDTFMVTDAAEVIDALLAYNVRAVLQGHTHINEDVTFRGLRFLTSGAVSGNWWKGTRAGSPEGFLEIRLQKDGQVLPRYRTYGFKSAG